MSVLRQPGYIKGPAAHTPAGGVAPVINRRTHAAKIAMHQHAALHGPASSIRRMPMGKFK